MPTSDDSLTSKEERRRFQRIAFDAGVDIRQGEKQWQADLIDISFKGALTSKPIGWQGDLSHPFCITVALDEEHDISLSASIKHEESATLGFQCDQMDLDSASTLRRLVELNLGDPALLERELNMLVSTDLQDNSD